MINGYLSSEIRSFNSNDETNATSINTKYKYSIEKNNGITKKYQIYNHRYDMEAT